LKQEEVLSQAKLITNQQQFFTQRYNDIFSFLFLLKQDPIAAHNELKKLLIEARIFLEKIGLEAQIDQRSYIAFLERIASKLKETKLIQEALPHFENYQRGGREIYSQLFKPDVIPNFTFTRLVSDLPEDVEIIDQYEISGGKYDKSFVTI